MKLSATQAQALFQIAYDSLHICGPLGGFAEEQRRSLVNEILNQQGSVIVNLADKSEPPPNLNSPL